MMSLFVMAAPFKSSESQSKQRTDLHIWVKFGREPFEFCQRFTKRNFVGKIHEYVQNSLRCAGILEHLFCEKQGRVVIMENTRLLWFFLPFEKKNKTVNRSVQKKYMTCIFFGRPARADGKLTSASLVRLYSSSTCTE